MDSKQLVLPINICGVDLGEREWFVGERLVHELPSLSRGLLKLIGEEKSRISLEVWFLVDNHIPNNILPLLSTMAAQTGITACKK